MKTIDFYNDIIVIETVLFKKYDLVTKTKDIINKLDSCRISIASNHDNVKSILDEFYMINSQVEFELKNSKLKCSEIIIEELKVNIVVGSIPEQKIKSIVEKYGLLDSETIKKIISLLKEHLTKIEDIRMAVGLVIASMKKIRDIQYEKFKTGFNNDIVLQLKMKKDFPSFKEINEIIDKTDKIFTSFKRLVNQESPGDNHIYSVDDGSIIIAVGSGIAVIKSILSCTKVFYDIRLQRERYKQEFEKNELFKTLNEELKEQIQRQMVKEIDFNEVAERLIKDSLNIKSTENENELKTLLIRSIKDLHKIIDQGGEIDLLEESKKEIMESGVNDPQVADIIEVIDGISNTQINIDNLSKKEEIKSLE